MNAHTKNIALANRLFDILEPSADHTRTASGITDVARTLRRAQLTLHRWSEEMCNGTIQREGPDGDGKPFRVWQTPWTVNRTTGKMYAEERRTPVPDREAGALRRVAKVCQEAGLHFYHQTDPRGCQLYVAAFPLDHSNYDRGVACL